jgi:hypothetical protein
MADKKISALTAASTPLAGTEVLPIVQSGSTVKVSISNVTVGRDVVANTYQVNNRLKINATHIADAAAPTGNDTGLAFSSRIYPCDSAGNLTNNTLSLGSSLYQFSSIHTGDNIVIGTAGKGIDFSANTHAAGMTSELLNDYEEGTWTPTYYGATGSAGSLAYAEQSGKYTKIGRQVTVTGTIILSNKGSWTGRIQIGGFPFVSLADQFTGNVELRNCTFTGNNVIIEIGRAGSDFARFVIVNGSGANSQLDDTMVANDSGFLFTLTYFV